MHHRSRASYEQEFSELSRIYRATHRSFQSRNLITRMFWCGHMNKQEACYSCLNLHAPYVCLFYMVSDYGTNFSPAGTVAVVRSRAAQLFGGWQRGFADQIPSFSMKMSQRTGGFLRGNIFLSLPHTMISWPRPGLTYSSTSRDQKPSNGSAPSSTRLRCARQEPAVCRPS